MATSPNSQADIVIACDLNAIPADRREQHELTGKKLFASVLEVRELPDAYAFRLPAESNTLIQAAQFITNERLCCPFWHFTLTLEPQSRALWLQLAGGAGAKQLLRQELDGLLSEPVAEAAGLR